MSTKRRSEAIEKKIEKLRKKLKKEKESNQSAWDTYGSELCAEEMFRREKKIEEEIRHFEKLLKMPEIEFSKEQLNEAKDEAAFKIKFYDGALRELKKIMEEAVEQEEKTRDEAVENLKALEELEML